MKLKLQIFFLLLTACSSLSAQQTFAERLGYQPEDKLLIIHADDLGVSHSENLASFLALKIGMVNSASIMMPCPWVAEVAAYAQQYPTADLGLHLTLTSEWEYMRWGPVAARDQVPSLVDSLGFFYADCSTFARKAKPEEVEIELRAQIEQAYKMGIRPSHLDTHMGCLVFSSPELFEIYLRLGREYQIPVMIGRFFLQVAPQAFKDLIGPKDMIIEKVITADIPDYEQGLGQYYEETLRNLNPGINILLIHTAFDDSEMQALTIDHPHWGADWRQQDFDFFTSKTCQDILAAEGIKLVSWRQIQKVMFPK